MIYIVGTNHELQHTDTPTRASGRGWDDVRAMEARNALKTLLKELVRTAQPRLIAEEMCTDVLDVKCAKSNAKEVADELGLEHRFCDPNLPERRVLGLPPYGSEDCDPETKKLLSQKREKYWFDQLSDVIDKDIIFVCGADHVTSFQDLLAGERVTSKVEEMYFGREIYAT